MIVVNKRYYDYDYDNNTIIMFDAEDVGLTLDLDDTIYSLDDDELLGDKDHTEMEKKQVSDGSAMSHTAIQSESTDTVPDDTNLIAPNTPPNNMAPNDSVLSPTPPNNSPKLNKKVASSNASSSSSSSNGGGVSWISSTSPKGMRHIPYSLHIAHSYTISKLQVSLTHLVDKKQYLRQKAEHEAKQAAILAQKHQQQYVQQYGHNQFMNNRHLRYFGPPHPQPPAAAPHHARSHSHSHRHPHQPQPYISPPQYHAARHVTPPQPPPQRKQDISGPTATQPPQPSRYGPQYMSYPK